MGQLDGPMLLHELPHGAAWQPEAGAALPRRQGRKMVGASRWLWLWCPRGSVMPWLTLGPKPP